MIEFLERLHLPQEEIIAMISGAPENHRLDREPFRGRFAHREIHRRRRPDTELPADLVSAGQVELYRFEEAKAKHVGGWGDAPSPSGTHVHR